MAKHWKSFVKKEKAPKKENEEIANIASLLSPDAKKSDKSLEDVAEINTSLKSLIDEQKKLEDEMAELTGKKKDSNTDKRYENEIKTIDQKKKEEAAAEEKRKKRKESNRKQQDDRWEVTPSFTPKKRAISSVPPISEKRKKATPNTGFIQPKKASKPAVRIPKVQRKPENTIVSKKKKKATSLLEFGKKIQTGKKTFDDFTKNPKKSVAKVPVFTSAKKSVTPKLAVPKPKLKPIPKKQKAQLPTSQKPKRQEKTLLKNTGKRNVINEIGRKKKSVEAISNAVKKGTEKLDSFINNAAKKKPVQTVKTVAKKASNAMDTFDTVTKKVSKVTDTFNTINKTGNELQTGIEKITSVVKSPELKTLSTKVSKGMGIVNKVGKKLNKVDKLFNTANKKLEKTKSVTNLFEKKLKAVDFISGKDATTKNAFDFGFIQKQQTKKEETQGFNVGNKKQQVDFNTIKDIKKGIDTFKSAKKQKDSFSL
ncbi:MAG: hypothetical protein AB8B65_04420 [Kordia sp.]|uniref:hypothetical protein n=1 Tax=Kordia sp. TaxID=1965332 RepID=UPI00385B9F45